MRRSRLIVYDDYSASQISTAIAEWVHNEKHRVIMYRKLIDGVTFERLAEESDMSVRQIKNIVYKLQNQLHMHL